MSWELFAGDCVEQMAAMQAESVDSIVADPPYGLEFMGKDWDRLGATVEPFAEELDRDGKVDYGSTARAMQAWHEAWAVEALRVLKPGGHLLAFGGTRTYHRLACAIEDAGFEIRDCLSWMYGSGFPKSMNVGVQVDKRDRGVEQGKADPSSPNHGRFKTSLTEGSRGRTDKGQHFGAGPGQFMREPGELQARDSSGWSEQAKRWEGWGTALKPAFEPIVVARKPLSGTVAANVLAHGTGALNVDGCRVAGAPELRGRDAPGNLPNGNGQTLGAMDRTPYEVPSGRWPANVLLSHTEDCCVVGTRMVSRSIIESLAEDTPGKNTYGSGGPGGGSRVELWACVPGCPVRALDEQTGERRSAGDYTKGASAQGAKNGAASIPIDGVTSATYSDTGGAARFFYCAKASRAERNAGLDGMEEKSPWTSFDGQYAQGRNPTSGERTGDKREQSNHHPTVKPISLMRWLVRLVTPPGGTVLDPFLGSGTTGCAAVLEGFDFIGVERDPEYCDIARARIMFWCSQPAGVSLDDAIGAEAARQRVADAGQLGWTFPQ